MYCYPFLRERIRGVRDGENKWQRDMFFGRRYIIALRMATADKFSSERMLAIAKRIV